MKFYFKLTDPSGKNIRFKISSGESLIIGRDDGEKQLAIDDPLCSSKHCKILARRNEVYIEDLKSKNGLFLNGVKILRQKIYLDDIIKIGNSVFFIDSDKLGSEEKIALSYLSSAEDGQNRSVTLELASHKQDLVFAQEPTSRVKKKANPRSRRTAYKNDRFKQQTPKEVALRYIENSIDFMITIFLFFSLLQIYKIFNPEITKTVLVNGWTVESMFHEKTISFVMVSIFISVLFYVANKKLPQLQLGNRILSFKR